jgi:thioesterase domain-containing protein
MALIELLKDLNSKNIKLNFLDGKLKYSGPQEKITPEILKRLKENKEELIKHLWSFEKYNLIPISLSGDKIPLILVHGGNSANFLPEFIKNERPLLNYLDLGSEGEKIEYKNIDSLARYYIHQLKLILPKGPYILCGFSFGGLLANTMANILQSEYKEKVPCLVMFDTQTPQAKRPTRVKNLLFNVKGNKLLFLFNALLKRIKKLNKFYYYYLIINKPLPSKYRKKYILQIYTKLSNYIVPAHVDSDLLLFISKDNEYIDPNLGWEGKVNKIETVFLDGDHLKILYLKENYSLIANKILSKLDSYNKD